MSSSAAETTQPSSPFSKLPLETIKQIVDEVNEQDKRWDENPITHRSRSAGSVGVEAGIFPASSGRGVVALSEVNKVIRELCLPHLLAVRLL
jgi:hypothetical protein